MYSAEKESTFPEGKTEENERNYTDIKDTYKHIYQKKIEKTVILVCYGRDTE